ncbi:MAG: DUF5320 domain-containing protein [Patescibacteria group bacterium]
MPRMNGTGPLGQGPMTGRGLGNCAGAQKSASSSRGRGLGRGCGRGCGRGGRFFGGQPLSLEDEEKMLSEELEAIKAERASLKEKK